MCEKIKLRARAVQVQNRGVFALVFALEAFGLAVIVAAGMLVYLRATSLRWVLLSCEGVLALFFCGAVSAGNALLFASAGVHETAMLRVFFRGFHPHRALRAVVGLLLSGGLQIAGAALFLLPAAGALYVCWRMLRAETELRTLAFVLLGAVVLLAVGLAAAVRLHTLLLVRPAVQDGRGAWGSMRFCLRLPEEAQREQRRLLRAFMGWFLLALLVVPLPFVWSYYRLSRTLLAKCFLAPLDQTQNAAYNKAV